MGAFIALPAKHASPRDDNGQRLLLEMRKGDRRSLQAYSLAVPDLQEDMVRKVPQAKNRPSVQEVGVPRVPHRDAGGRPHEREEVDTTLLKAESPGLG